MENKDIIALLNRYKSGTCTEQERAVLESWYLANDPENIAELSPEEFGLDLLMIGEGLPLIRPAGVRKLWPGIAVAVAATVAIVFGIWFFSSELGVPKQDKNDLTYKHDFAPGKNIAILTLANGKTIKLSDTKTGVVIGDSSLKYNDGSAITPLMADGAKVGMTSLSTPRGGTYQIILPDGTKVWLNAASSLQFPAKFTGSNRVVTLVGEGYFEVARNKNMPFKVKLADQSEIEVLGTHFNVTAYADEGTFKTTLLEGSVKVSKAGVNRMLVPGQQAEVTAGLNKISLVKDADLTEVMAWRNGLFLFKDSDLETIMKQISRWYDVDIRFQGMPLKTHFRAEVSRNVNLSQVLEILELSGVKFKKLEGRKIIVIQ